MEESEEIKKETKRRNPKRKSAISTEKEKKDADESAGEIKFPKPPRKSRLMQLLRESFDHQSFTEL